MTVDILLSHGYFLHEDEKELQIMKPYPTLGLLYLSAYLKRAGFGVEVFDTTFAPRPQLMERLDAGKGVIGLYTNLMTRPSILQIARAAKERGWTVVLGGPESANYPEEYLSRGADVIVTGEGERTLAELLPALAARGPHRLHGLPGVTFTDEQGLVVKGPPRAQIEDIDSLPFPDREAIDQDRYVEVWRTHHGMGSVNLITARGCPYKCEWCSHSTFGYSHRRRRPRHCADEVAEILERYKPEQLWYADDVFTISHPWLFEYRDEILRRGLKRPFETISRADRLMKDEVLQALADLGCYRVWIGSESGSQRILDSMRRGVKVEQVQWATKAAQRYGMQVGMFLMWGYDGETLEDIEATIEHVKQSNPDIFFTTVSYPIKGTPYYDKVAARSLLSRSWETATDRDFQIQGRHSRNYYRHADRWLRNEVAAFRAGETQPAEAEARREEARAAREALLGATHEVEA